MQTLFVLLLMLGLAAGFAGALYLIISALVGLYRQSEPKRKNSGGNR